jgi:hypothetical protein
MSKTCRTAVAGLTIGLLLGAGAEATDHPVSGRKLVIKRAASGTEKLVFVSKDPALPFPAIGGPDDPASEDGAVVDVFTQNEGMVSFLAPAGLGKPGWIVRQGARGVYKFVDPPPGGLSALRVLILKEGRLLKVVAKTTGLPLAGPLGRVGVRVTTGSLRSCAGFDTATIRKDDAGHYAAKNAPADTLADCSDASLSGLTPCGETVFPECGGACPAGSVCASQDLSTCTCVSSADPCGGTAPVCNGTCPAAEVCTSQGSPPFNSCTCAPIGATLCGNAAFPTCGGDCPAGEDCHPFMFSTPGVPDGCGCAPPGSCGSGGAQCPPGFACAVAPGFEVCAPIPCGGNPAYPTCDGACPDGFGCHAIQFSDAAFAACLCAPPGACDATCGGYDCGPGGVCVTDTGLSSCGCQ